MRVGEFGRNFESTMRSKKAHAISWTTAGLLPQRSSPWAMATATRQHISSGVSWARSPSRVR